MPATTPKPTRTRTTRPPARVPSAGRAAVPAAAGVNPLRLPRQVHDLTARSLAPLREQAFAAWVNDRRSSLAALLLMTLDQGTLTEADIHAAFDHPQRHERLYGLFGTALQALPDVLDAVARRYVLHPDALPHWESFVQIRLNEDADGIALVLTAQAYWLHVFDLDTLPPALAVAIAHTLDLIGIELTESVPARDLAEMWRDEAIMTYHDLQATGLNDLDALWAHVQDDTDLTAWYDWESSEDFARWWMDLASFCDPARSWQRRWLAQRHRPAALRRRLIRRLWRGRRQPTLSALPWFRWLRRAVLTLCRCARRWPEPPGRALTQEDGIEAEPLAYAQMLCFGEVWEDEFLEYFSEYALNNGLNLAWSLRAEALAWEDLFDTLEAFAIGQGLLIGANQANQAYLNTH